MFATNDTNENAQLYAQIFIRKLFDNDVCPSNSSFNSSGIFSNGNRATLPSKQQILLYCSSLGNKYALHFGHFAVIGGREMF